MANIKNLILIFLVLIVVGLLVIYGTGLTNFNFKTCSQDHDFNSKGYSEMQFYTNMRYVESNISYGISEKCNIEKEEDAKRAFEILQNKTILSFYEVEESPEILIQCDSKIRRDNNLYIAGEGGPVNITKSGELHVIKYGEVLLIKEPVCNKPNVAIHEILHSLGFVHSSNPSSIMYNTTKCCQEIGKDIPSLIEAVYSFENKPDLAFTSASLKDNLLNISISNKGLADSHEFDFELYQNENLVHKENIMEGLNLGQGINMALSNLNLKNSGELVFKIQANFSELNKSNNEMILDLSEE